MIGAIFKGLFPTAGAVPYKFGHDSLLHCIEARRGRGKSYLMANLVVDLAEQRIPMWVNTTSLDFYRVGLELVRRDSFSSLTVALDWLAENVTFLRSWDDIFEAYNGVLIFDECVRHFDSRPGMAAPVPKLFWEWARQTRKLMMTVYFLSHSVEYLDNRVSRLLDVFWMVRKVADKTRKAPDGTSYPVRFFAYGNDPGGAGKVDSVNRLSADLLVTVPFRLAIARCYESRGLINEIEGDSRFDTVRAIRELHESLGRVIGIDGQQALARHRSRLADDEKGEAVDGGGAFPKGSPPTPSTADASRERLLS